MRNIISFTKGLLSFFPKISVLERSRGTGGTINARYCYGVWMKHMSLMFESGMQKMPETMVELGPGDSIGIGLAALLSGVNHYYGLDVVKFASKEKNHEILNELIRLFRTKEPLREKGWPDFSHLLDENYFPSHILSAQRLNQCLSDKRITLIRKAIDAEFSVQNEISIHYIVPWNTKTVIVPGTVDMILSHAVMEYVKDLDFSYDAMHYWLAEGGIISHQIDFRSHGLSDKWNGHWAYSERAWNLIKGKRSLIINRQPYSVHHNLLVKNGVNIVSEYKSRLYDGYKKSQLSKTWKNISDDDRSCSGAFIQAMKLKR
ncbi:MAG: hypothetical protein JXB49_36415 [Bacteroidales bacterium]|nr:hypothetical protein [Bacteroidales bacterium]